MGLLHLARPFSYETIFRNPWKMKQKSHFRRENHKNFRLRRAKNLIFIANFDQNRPISTKIAPDGGENFEGENGFILGKTRKKTLPRHLTDDNFAHGKHLPNQASGELCFLMRDSISNCDL